jgi:hypothetical protein
MISSAGSRARIARLETDLVIALAGAAVGDVLCAVLVGDVDEVLGDDGAGECGEQRIDALVLAVCPDGLRQDRLGVLLAHVDGLRGDGAHIECLLLDPGKVLLVLADVAADSDDVHVLLYLQPLDDDGSIESARVCKYDLLFFCHDFQLLNSIEWQTERFWHISQGACISHQAFSRQKCPAMPGEVRFKLWKIA